MLKLESGISETGIDRLILDLYDYSDKCNKLSNEIRDLIDSSKSFYITNDGDRFRKNFNKFYNGTEKLNKNILTIVSDLNNVKVNYKKRDSKSADFFETVDKKKISTKKDRSVWEWKYLDLEETISNQQIV